MINLFLNFDFLFSRLLNIAHVFLIDLHLFNFELFLMIFVFILLNLIFYNRFDINQIFYIINFYKNENIRILI